MADNYLERRMDDYRSGRLAAPRAARPSSAKGLAVHVAGEGAEPYVEALRAFGARVSFSGVDPKKGAAIAQRTGSTCCPLPLDVALERMERARGGLDALLVVGGDIPATGFPAFVVGESAPEGASLLSPQLPADAVAAIVMSVAPTHQIVEVNLRKCVGI